jgi:hypothetical protein
MRNALNNNPRVQIGVLAVLVVLAGLFFVPTFMHKKAATTPPTTTSSASLTSPAGSVNVTAGVTPSTGAAATAAPTAAPAPTSVAPGSFTAGPGLPAPVVKAWKDGNVVVLLVVRPGATDDRLVRESVEALSGDSGVTVFVTHADKIARYSRVTQGVGVSQVPALVVIRPRRLSGSVPQAQVTYGFRNAQSVVQQVHDALYSGKDNLPYSPR